jgi:hypothetical protein
VASHILGADLVIGLTLPDIAHDASAIAPAMRIQNENGHGVQS